MHSLKFLCNLCLDLVLEFVIYSFIRIGCQAQSVEKSCINKYMCSGCNSTYIGKTIRQLMVRVIEYIGRFSRTGVLLKKPPFSALVLFEMSKVVCCFCANEHVAFYLCDDFIIYSENKVPKTQI